MKKKTYTVFYAWQSDLKDVKKQISAILGNVQHQLKKDYKINIKIAKATTKMQGSGAISDELLKKVSEADFFVGDVSIIHDEEVKPRRTSNPNVLFELGYAVACLGWERIFMVVNRNEDLDNLPFDIKHRRVFLADSSLSSKICNSISLTIKGNSSKPYLGSMEIERQKADTRVLGELFQTFELRNFADWLTTDDATTKTEILSYQYCSEKFFNSIDYRLYDKELEELINEFKKAMDALLIPVRNVYENKPDDFASFNFLDKNDTITINEKYIPDFLLQKKKLGVLLKKLINYVRWRYPAVDLIVKNENKPWLKSLPSPSDFV